MNRREALLALMSLPEVSRVSVATLKPNDVIVFECDGHVSMETAKRIEENLKRVWPDHRCIVLADGAKLKVVAG